MKDGASYSKVIKNFKVTEHSIQDKALLSVGPAVGGCTPRGQARVDVVLGAPAGRVGKEKAGGKEAPTSCIPFPPVQKSAPWGSFCVGLWPLHTFQHL